MFENVPLTEFDTFLWSGGIRYNRHFNGVWHDSTRRNHNVRSTDLKFRYGWDLVAEIPNFEETVQ